MASCVFSGDSWMTNRIGQDPCVIAGHLYTPCSGGPGFTIDPLPSNSHYIPGNEEHNPTACSCSWAVYNLLQACAACQTANGDQGIDTWANWETICSASNTSLLTISTWFPPAFAIPNGTAVPYWATQNPTLWLNGRFDLAIAKAIAEVLLADTTNVNNMPTETLTPLNFPHSHDVSIAGAVSGSVGGLIVLLALIFVLNKHLHRRRTVELQKRHIDEEEQHTSPFFISNATPLRLLATSSDNVTPKQSDENKGSDLARVDSIPSITQSEEATERDARLAPITSNQEPWYHRDGGRVEFPPAYSQIGDSDRVSS